VPATSTNLKVARPPLTGNAVLVLPDFTVTGFLRHSALHVWPHSTRRGNARRPMTDIVLLALRIHFAMVSISFLALVLA
jgi:hypothetical protein